MHPQPVYIETVIAAIRLILYPYSSSDSVRLLSAVKER